MVSFWSSLMFKNKVQFTRPSQKCLKQGTKLMETGSPKQHEHMWGSFDVTDGIVFADRAC